MGEHLPCKQGVESSNLLVSIRRERNRRRTLKTEYRNKDIKKKEKKKEHPRRHARRTGGRVKPERAQGGCLGTGSR